MPLSLPIHGRGAAENPPNRFERIRVEADPEADAPAPDGEGSGPPQTVYLRDTSRSIIAENDSPDVGFRFSINPYRGCEHGCIYCYARPTHEYLGFSAGLDFETRVLVKTDAPELLRKELSSRRWSPDTISISGVTDCYQPVERSLRITRRCLEVLLEFRNPCGIITKSHTVTRDVDVLSELARFDCAIVLVSVTTLDADLSRRMEPRAAAPGRRLDAIRTLADAGVPVGVMVAPVVPGLTDHEVPAILQAAADVGARCAGFVPLRLPGAVAPLFDSWLGQHLPDRKDKILNRVRSMRGGKLNDTRFGSRMRGEGLFAEQIRSVFEMGKRKAGLAGGFPKLATEHFRRIDNAGPGLFD